MEEYIENYVSENTALRSKLQAKTEALKILARELDKCRTERDQFKLMAEQIQERYSCLKKKSCHINLYTDSGGGNVAQLLGETRENNKLMKLELEATKQCLIEARGDIRVLRQQLQSKQKHNSLTNEDVFPVHQREELVEQLEKLSAKTIQMRADIQSLLDEKEELIKERDAFKHKAHRVSHELAVALRITGQNTTEQDSTNDSEIASKTPAFLVDADALVSENRYLHERLQQAEAETQLATQALAKYKNMLETKRRKGIIKLGTNNTDMIMSHKQVKQLLERGTMAELPVTSATIADLKSLCLGLLETLGDKTLALSHQKKANKILASRVSELESKLGKGSAFPSHILLENYSSAEADRQDVSEEFKFCKQIKSHSSLEHSNSSDVEVNGVDKITDEDDIDKLPPKLQEMVDKALEELKIEL